MIDSPVAIAALMPHPPVLVPAVGRDRLPQIQASSEAMQAVAREIVAVQPDSIVVISPHSPRHPFAFGVWSDAELHGSFAQFGAGDCTISLPNDPAFVNALLGAAPHAGIQMQAIGRGSLDHGAMVPLWFLIEAGWHGPTVVVALNHPGAGGLHGLGRAIAGTARSLGKQIALIASGDMSHRLIPGAPAGYEPNAHQFDARFIELLRTQAYRDIERINPVLQSRAAEDVVDSSAVAMAATNWQTNGGRVLSYEGPFGVGYGVAVLFSAAAAEENAAGGSILPGIARRAVESACASSGEAPPAPGNDYLCQRQGVFVTIRTSGGKLRGCMGSLETPQTPNLVAETWHNARLAAFRDPRFSAVTAVELHNLRFAVSVLRGFEEIASRDQLDPARYGVIVSTPDGRRATLLPGIAGIDTFDQQWRTVCEKGRIDPAERVRIVRYEVDKFAEPGCAD